MSIYIIEQELQKSINAMILTNYFKICLVLFALNYYVIILEFRNYNNMSLISFLHSLPYGVMLLHRRRKQIKSVCIYVCVCGGRLIRNLDKQNNKKK